MYVSSKTKMDVRSCQEKKSLLFAQIWMTLLCLLVTDRPNTGSFPLVRFDSQFNTRKLL